MGDDNSKKKIKRVRTAFTEDQLEVLQTNFEMDSNPDGQDLERIAINAGLSKRVTQVWFQNARARQKKHSYYGKRKSMLIGLASFDLQNISIILILSLQHLMK